MNWPLLQNSLLVSGGATLLALVFGFAVALGLAGWEARARNAGLALAVAVLALPPFLVTNSWLHYLGGAGAWRNWLPLNLLSLGGTAWLLALLTWPLTTLLVWGAWQRLEAAQFEADPAVRGWALVRHLLWPRARTALGQAALLTFVLALNNFAVPTILQVKVFPAELWVRFSADMDSLGALRMSLPLVLAPVLVLLWLTRSDVAWPRLSGAVSASVFRRQLGDVWIAGSGFVAVAALGLSAGLPLGQIVLSSRTWSEWPGALAAGRDAVWNSFFFAALAATAVVGGGVAGAMRSLKFEVRSPKSGKRREPATEDLPSDPVTGRSITAGHFGFRVSDFFRTSDLGLRTFAWLPFFTPGVLLGIGWIALLNRPGWFWLYQGSGIVVVALAVRYLAVGLTGVRHALQATDPLLADVARLEGASRWQLLRYVLWPQIAPQVVAAWYVVYLLCLWDVESLVLVLPPGGETLALRIFNLLHYGHNAQVNALCLTLLLVALAPLLVAAAWIWMRGCFAGSAVQHPPAWSQASQPASAGGILPPVPKTRGRDASSTGPQGCGPPRFMGARNGLLVNAVFHGALPLLAVALLLSGCSPASQKNEATVESRCFSRVQVFGAPGVGVGQFNKPRSVAVDTNNNFYVADMTGRVQKFSPNGGYMLAWQMPQTDLGKPKGMARDAAGNVVVIEPHYQRVNHFTPEGRLVAQWGVSGTNAGQLKLPRAVAVDLHGEILVCEYGLAERVQRFAVASGGPGQGEGKASFLSGFGHAGTGPGEFNRPEGLAVDAQDRIYVADSCNHRVQVFDRDGHFLRVIGKPGRGSGELSYPYDVCVDRAGRVYVCEFGNSRVQIFDAQGVWLETLGGPGAAPGQFNSPRGLALDAQENLYVADTMNHRVQKFLRRAAGVAEIRNPKSEIRNSKLGRAETHEPARDAGVAVRKLWVSLSRRADILSALDGRFGREPSHAVALRTRKAGEDARAPTHGGSWAQGMSDRRRELFTKRDRDDSDFGFRISFKSRISDFGFSTFPPFYS